MSSRNDLKTTPQKVLLRVEEAARLCGYSRSFLYQRIAAGEVPVVREGRTVRVPATWVARIGDEAIAAWERARAGKP